MLTPKLYYRELKKIKKVDNARASRDSVEVLKSSKSSDKDDVVRPRFRRLNTPMGPSKFIPLSTLQEDPANEAPWMKDLPPERREYVDSQNLQPSNIAKLQEDVDELAEEQSLTLEEAADLLDKAYGPEKIFVWLVKVMVFNGLMLGTLGFAMSFPTSKPSLPSFTLWAACTVAFASFVTLFGCIFVSFARRVVELRSGTFMSVINSGLSVTASVSVLWFFYGLLTIGKRDSASVINNLSKLLWPLTFPLQGTPFVLGAAFLIMLILLFLVTSYKATPIKGSNRMFFNHGFLFLSSFMKAFIQIMSNRGYVVCDLRSNPWAASNGSVYSFWNRSYAIWVTVNSILAISFVLSLAGDLKVDRRLAPVGGKHFPYAKVVHCAFIAGAFLSFMLFDVTASQGRNDIIESSTAGSRTSKQEKAFHTLYNLSVLALAGIVAVIEVDWLRLVVKEDRKSDRKEDRIGSDPVEYKKDL
eukprot:746317-Hanusia_phi.AAC.5